MPGTDSLIVLAVVAGAMVLFVTEKLRVDLVALCVLLGLLLLGLIRPEQALYGFASPATATVAAMFVLSAGLVRTGLVEWIGRRIDAIAGRTQTQLVLILCLTIAALSAFVVNTATVAIFIPVAIALAKARKISPSRVLIPLSFASQFGGVCTLIGTSTNILVNSIAISNGLVGFHLFEFAPLGLVMSGVGIVYLLSVAGWLLPKRKGEYQQIDKYRLVDYLAEFRVKKMSPLVNTAWEKDRPKDLADIDLIKIIRGNKATWSASATTIKEGDILLVHGNADKLMKMKDNYKLETKGDEAMHDQKLSSDEVKLIEALIPPRSNIVGRTLRSSDFKRRFRCVVLAIQRRGKILRDRLVDIRFDGGDTLLLQCDKEEVNRIMRSGDLIVTNELTELHLRKNRAALALGLVGLVVALAALNVVPILIAALIGAVGMVLGRCLTLEEAYQAIDWKVIVLLGGILPLGLALQQTGTAAWLANSVLEPLVAMGPLVVLAALYIFTAVLTETMSNNTAAILLAPIALSLAVALGVNPRPFLIAITFAASTSFATPIGYQTNTMIYAPGGYRFFDYTKVGAPLNILFWITAILLVPVLWPF
ncbi:MAG: SLC13 family permease [candidate division WOR-3 bacterium]|nr:MAG: SLC13 family permease [candidate division WOR-3 bacterium]